MDAEEVDYEQDDERGVELMYGITVDDDREAQVEEITGSIVAANKRMVAFPNTLQHRVDPFRLEDPTKPGHRKIVAFFLVDPSLHILSTADVMSRHLDLFVDEIGGHGYFGKLPTAIVAKIGSYAGLLELDEAKAERLELMEARKKWAKDRDVDETFSNLFNLCEH